MRHSREQADRVRTVPQQGGGLPISPRAGDARRARDERERAHVV